MIRGNTWQDKQNDLLMAPLRKMEMYFEGSILPNVMMVVPNGLLNVTKVQVAARKALLAVRFGLLTVHFELLTVHNGKSGVRFGWMTV